MPYVRYRCRQNKWGQNTLNSLNKTIKTGVTASVLLVFTDQNSVHCSYVTANMS